MSDFPPPPPFDSPSEPLPVAQQAPRNGLGIAALIMGIIVVIAGVVPSYFCIAGILLGTTGLVLGLIGYGRVERGEATNGTMALWGIITSAVAVVISIVAAAILVGGNLADELTADDPAETFTRPQAEDRAPTGTEEIDVYELEEGDCLAEIGEAENSSPSRLCRARSCTARRCSPP